MNNRSMSTPWAIQLRTAAAGAILLACATAIAGNAHAEPPPHVVAAQHVVDALDLSNTDYAHGQGTVDWSGTVASHTDCSGFIDHLLMHVDGYAPDDFKRWFGSRRPTARRYHDAIVEGRGFTSVAKVEDLLPGDLIAIKYITRQDNTGHVMLVVDAPRRITPSVPIVEGTTQWAITVIDSSESGHGPADTRHKHGSGGNDHDGLGRGEFRLYADKTGAVAGFAWSTAKASRFVPPADEHAVLGRFIANFHP
jgi:NlpC/P60 family